MANSEESEARMVRLRSWIGQAQDALDMSQSELAASSGLRRETLRLLMSVGKRPQPATLRQLEDAFGVPENALDDVMAGHPVPVPTRRPPKSAQAGRDKRLDAIEAEQRTLAREYAAVAKQQEAIASQLDELLRRLR